MFLHQISINRRLFFTIVDPQNKNNKKTVRTELKNVEPCSLMNNESHVNEKDQAQAVNQLKVIIPISISVLVLVVLLMVVVACVCSKRFRYKKVMKVDMNMNYDTAGVDYEYGSADYDSMGDETSTGRREIKMEVVDRFLKESFLSLDFSFSYQVVDRSSVYGKTNEDWEDAVAVDNNPDYEI